MIPLAVWQLLLSALCVDGVAALHVKLNTMCLMSSYPNMVVDFSDTAPDSVMLWKLEKIREISKPIRDFARIKILDRTVAYSCCPRHSDIIIALIVADYDEAGISISGTPYAMGLTDRAGLTAADYRHVKCYLGCKWRCER